MQNDLQEFYAIIEFVNPGILGSSTAYRKVYEEPILRSRQPSCTEVMLHLSPLIFSCFLCSILTHTENFIWHQTLYVPTGGENFGRRASSRALSPDRHVHPEANPGDHQLLPPSSS